VSNVPITPTSPAGEGTRRDSDEDDDGAVRAHEEPLAPAPDVAATGTVESMDYEEDAVLTMSSSQRRTRLSLALGAGLSVVNRDAAPQASLAVRYEVARRRALFGVEPSLWLVDGLQAQGSLLGTAGYRVAPRLELGSGLGVRLTGDGTGPALGLSLRTQLTRGFQVFLRYDGALLIRSGTFDGQNTGSVGLEASF
jgi:hypothetical protein